MIVSLLRLFGGIVGCSVLAVVAMLPTSNGVVFNVIFRKIEIESLLFGRVGFSVKTCPHFVFLAIVAVWRTNKKINK